MSSDLKALIAKLDSKSKDILERAVGLCVSSSHYDVEVEHWLLKLLQVDDRGINYLKDVFSFDIDAAMNRLQMEIGTFKTGNTRTPALSPRIIDLIKRSWVLVSVDLGGNRVLPHHILFTILLDDGFRRSTNLFDSEIKKISPEALMDALKELQLQGSGAAVQSNESSPGHERFGESSLDRYTIDLTRLAKDGHIDSVIGRDKEIRQMIDILIRRRQNNPILTGEAGVGKTAVVEGLAMRIVKGDVPQQLKNICLRTLDLGLLQAGASVKGEFENRLKSVIQEVKSSPVPVILFVDEAHTLIGAGGKEGQGDAANLLKPALARGELRTIAATTWAEYKKYFERDPALTRRFQVVKVEEPSETDAINMMRSIRPTLEAHHNVRILDQAVVESVRLSSRYIPARQLPDKSVSLLDTACARVALSKGSEPSEIEDVRRNIQKCRFTIDSLSRENKVDGLYGDQIFELMKRLELYEAELIDLESRLLTERQLVSQILAAYGALDDAVEGADDFEAIRVELAHFKHQLTEVQGSCPLVRYEVTGEVVADIVASWTGIPVGKMLADEVQKIINLQDFLSDRIVGQTHALAAISECVRTSRAGLTDPRKPIGVFLMVGPSGVGKTETAMALADALYGGDHNVTVINMSEFKEEHKVSMLLGSPPGYVGFGEGGVLTEAVRRKPYSVILLDEMEKAHPGVQDIFYNLFDKGTIKDGEGRDIDFKNTIIIMTSNAAEEHIRAICSQSDERPDPKILLDNFRPQLLKYFRPAFLGRTTIIPYYPLNDEELLQIAEISLARLRRRISDHYKAAFTYHHDVALYLVGQAQDMDTGARSIENIIARSILPSLATRCLAALADGESVRTIHIGVTGEGEFMYDINQTDCLPSYA